MQLENDAASASLKTGAKQRLQYMHNGRFTFPYNNSRNRHTVRALTPLPEIIHACASHQSDWILNVQLLSIIYDTFNRISPKVSAFSLD